MNLDSAFKSDCLTRDKFLARLFGIFSEEIVRIWCRSPESPYEDLGRALPYVKVEGGEGKPSILDFTLRDRDTSLTYVAEMKCELEYWSYKYLLLESEDQLTHHNRPAFEGFLGVARDPSAYQVKIKRQLVEISGSILIWGSVSDVGRRKVREATKILSLKPTETCQICPIWLKPPKVPHILRSSSIALYSQRVAVTMVNLVICFTR